MGYLLGYYLDRGFRPEEILSLGREERVTYLAIAELNEQKRMEDMERAFENAMIHVLNQWMESKG